MVTHKSKQFAYKTMAALAAATSIVALLAANTLPAYADVTNTATASGLSPSGGSVSGVSNTVAVDPVDAVSTLTLTKVPTFANVGDDADGDGEADAGDIITYTYTVSNLGNTTLTSVDIVDTHDGDGTTPAPLLASWTNQPVGSIGTAGDASITMMPGAIAVFTATYEVTATDVLNSGADADLDNSAVATGDYYNGVTTASVPSPAATASVPYDVNATLSVAKTAYEVDYPLSAGGSAGATAANAERPAGTVIYYVYQVTNTGNVPVTNITMNDVHNGLPSGVFTQPQYYTLTNTSGLSANPGSDNTVDTLYPGDVAIYRTSYTITQTDVDQNQ